MEKFEVRTDLALEVNEEVSKSTTELHGIIVREHVDEESDIKITVLEITNSHGAKLLGKPIGKYVTIEASDLSEYDDAYNNRASEILAKNIFKLLEPNLKHKKHCSLLVVGLGNREVTADSLGPDVVENLLVNRHLPPELSGKADITIAGLSPGVMAQTGMETAEIIKGIVAETKPDIVIAIDALAARNTERLNTTIQLSDQGIHPGSGVGNHRVGITKENIGVPVLAIGVPTVIDAPTIVNDSMENFMKALAQSEQLRSFANVMEDFTPEEKYQLVKEIISPAMVDMYVTPKDVDENIKVIGYTVSEAINMVAQKKLA